MVSFTASLSSFVTTSPLRAVRSGGLTADQLQLSKRFDADSKLLRSFTPIDWKLLRDERGITDGVVLQHFMATRGCALLTPCLSRLCTAVRTPDTWCACLILYQLGALKVCGDAGLWK